MSQRPPRYRAFISYSHRDAAAARRLHRRLEAYRLPKGLTAGDSNLRHVRPVFLDRDELASATALSDSLCSALDDSAALIAVCSPAAANSRWVNEEIRYFRSRHPNRPALAFVIDGDPGVDPRADTGNAALPLSLLLLDPDRPDGAVREPIAADARANADGFDGALMKTLAGLLGLRLDDLRRREFRRRQQQWAMLSGIFLVLTLAFAWLAWQATQARNEATAARAQAELELKSEQQTRQFLLSVFQLADPNESRGNRVTVREVLDQAVARIDQTEFAQPVIKSRFLATLGRAYASLGLNKRSTDLLRASLTVLPTDESGQESQWQRIDVQTDLANVLFNAGDYEAAAQHADIADRLITDYHADDGRRARLHNVLGDILSRSGDSAKARTHYEQALALAARPLPGSQSASIEGSAQLGLAFLDFDEGEHASAEQRFAAAAGRLQSQFGSRHPLTLTAMTSRGANAYASADRETARTVWTEALAISLDIFDANSPEIGTLKNNLGRLLLEDGDLHTAETYLRDALASDRAHGSAEFDDLTYSLHNLAYVRLVADDTDEAQTLLREALRIAEARQHDMLGPILLALADTQCMRAQTDEGLSLAERGATTVQATLDATHWRQQQAVLTRQYCLARAGRDVDVKAAETALAGIRDRWPEQGAFTRRAVRQWQEISSRQR